MTSNPVFKVMVLFNAECLKEVQFMLFNCMQIIHLLNVQCNVPLMFSQNNLVLV